MVALEAGGPETAGSDVAGCETAGSVMARFNNLSELKQEVRLHIIQMETSLFKQYQTVNHLLHNDKAIAECG
ncbi:hypothetical protein AB0M20_29595 [Actinoplanes sp. NPDC051633]|uniref:hypothetical protein n=1 Tax=Actinoplanes sp. NPDC051633 TaxID=3155670 RepID=UPI003435842F